jgi:hypothetical protein
MPVFAWAGVNGKLPVLILRSPPTAGVSKVGRIEALMVLPAMRQHCPETRAEARFSP